MVAAAVFIICGDFFKEMWLHASGLTIGRFEIGTLDSNAGRVKSETAVYAGLVAISKVCRTLPLPKSIFNKDMSNTSVLTGESDWTLNTPCLNAATLERGVSSTVLSTDRELEVQLRGMYRLGDEGNRCAEETISVGDDIGVSSRHVFSRADMCKGVSISI